MSVSKALRRNRCLGMWECDRVLGCVRSAIAVLGVWRVRSLFGILGVRSLVGDIGSAIAFGDAIAVLVMLGVRSLFGDVGNAIAFGM
jgi:hypothetical protein